MVKQKEFDIPFSGLSQGKHGFDYSVKNKFFESFDYNEFNSADINVHAQLNKMTTMLELELSAKGTVNVNCDITNEPFDQPISGDLELVIKFGEEYNNENDEILIIPHGEHQINIAQYVYEYIILAVPVKRVHPGIADGTLKSEILDKLEELSPKGEEDKEPSEEIDPRWESLRKLLTDK